MGRGGVSYWVNSRAFIQGVSKNSVWHKTRWNFFFFLFWRETLPANIAPPHSGFFPPKLRFEAVFPAKKCSLYGSWRKERRSLRNNFKFVAKFEVISFFFKLAFLFGEFVVFYLRRRT